MEQNEFLGTASVGKLKQRLLHFSADAQKGICHHAAVPLI